jgi:hypothetical protein
MLVKCVCDAPGATTWFRLESEAEAAAESELMQHAVEKHFRGARAKAQASFVPASSRYIEQAIGLEAHIQRHMPLFVTLRDGEGNPLVTAMLPPRGEPDPEFRPIIVGRSNGDPYPQHADAIRALGDHFGLELDRRRCFPYKRA